VNPVRCRTWKYCCETFLRYMGFKNPDW